MNPNLAAIATGLILAGCTATSLPAVTITHEVTTTATVTAAPEVDQAGDIDSVPADNSGTVVSGFTEAESAYIAALDLDPDEDDPVDVVADGHDMCASLKKKKSDNSRAFMMLDWELDWSLDDYKPAVTHLCAKYKPALKLATGGFTDGNNTVGNGKKDTIKPGTYRTREITDSCYWARTTKHGKILANDFITNAPAGARVTIRSSDGGFESEGCGSWIPTK